MPYNKEMILYKSATTESAAAGSARSVATTLQAKKRPKRELSGRGRRTPEIG